MEVYCIQSAWWWSSTRLKPRFSRETGPCGSNISKTNKQTKRTCILQTVGDCQSRDKNALSIRREERLSRPTGPTPTLVGLYNSIYSCRHHHHPTPYHVCFPVFCQAGRLDGQSLSPYQGCCTDRSSCPPGHRSSRLICTGKKFVLQSL